MPATAAPAKPAAKTDAEPLKVGVSHERVGHLQNRLNSLGAGLNVDGVYGPKTHAEVAKRQQEWGLNPDGVVGPKTTAALRTPPADKSADAKGSKAASKAGSSADTKADAAGAKKPSTRFVRKIEIDDKGTVKVMYREGPKPEEPAPAGAGAVQEAADGVPNWKAVGAHAKKKLSGLVRHYMSKPHPFGACVTDNTKRFGPDRAKRVCAVLKDIGHGGTGWRKGSKKGAVTEAEVNQAVGRFVEQLVEAGMDSIESVELVESYLVSELPEDAVFIDEAAAGSADPGPFDLAEARGGAASKLLKRLPDGTFAPKGRGQILRRGQKVRVPHRDGTGNVKGHVVSHDLATRSARVKLADGPDKGVEFTVKAEGMPSTPVAAARKYKNYEAPRPVRNASASDIRAGDHVELPDDETFHGRHLRVDSYSGDRVTLLDHESGNMISRSRAEFDALGMRRVAPPKHPGHAKSFSGPRAPAPNTAPETPAKAARKDGPWHDSGGAVVPDHKLWERYQTIQRGATSTTVTRALPDGDTAARLVDWLNANRSGEFEAYQANNGTGSWFVRGVRRDRPGTASPPSGDPKARTVGSGSRRRVVGTPEQEAARGERNSRMQRRQREARQGTSSPSTASPERAARDAAAAKAHPEGSMVRTTVHGAGGRSESVTGRVVGHRRGQLVVETSAHGRIMVPLDKVEDARAQRTAARDRLVGNTRGETDAEYARRRDREEGSQGGGVQAEARAKRQAARDRLTGKGSGDDTTNGIKVEGEGQNRRASGSYNGFEAHLYFDRSLNAWTIGMYQEPGRAASAKTTFTDFDQALRALKPRSAMRAR